MTICVTKIYRKLRATCTFLGREFYFQPWLKIKLTDVFSLLITFCISPGPKPSSHEPTKTRKPIPLAGIPKIPRRLQTPLISSMVRAAKQNRRRARDLQQKYRKKCREVQQLKIRREEDALAVIKEKVTPMLFRMLQCQMRNAHRKPRGRRYLKEERVMFMGIHKRGRSGYNALDWIKPTRKTLRKTSKKFNIKPGINQVLLEALKTRSDNMEEEKKDVVMIFDETASRRQLEYDASSDQVVGLVDLGDGERRNMPADEVLIAMIRSLYSSWKQPLFYWPTHRKLTGHDFKKIFQESVEAVQRTGLRVRCMIVDGLGKNRTALGLLGVTTATPWCLINGAKVYAISDVCHLLKCLRNALLVYDLQLRNGTYVKKEFIDKFIRFDMQVHPRIAKKVTEVHLNPTSFQKMNVGIAKQLLSRKVASGISICALLNYMPPEAHHTAAFLEKISDLFDSQTGTEVVKDPLPNQFKCALTATSGHLRLWNEMYAEIQQWQFPGSKNLQFPDNWLLTLRATAHLWSDLQKENHEYLIPGNLISDPIENLNCQLRDLAGPKRTFTIKEFPPIFSSALVNSLTTSARGKNCKDDNALNLLHLQTLCDVADRMASQQQTPLARGLFQYGEQLPAPSAHFTEEQEEEEEEDDLFSNDGEDAVLEVEELEISHHPDPPLMLPEEEFQEFMKTKIGAIKTAQVAAPIVQRHSQALDCEECTAALQCDAELFPLHLLATLQGPASAATGRKLPSEAAVKAANKIYGAASTTLPAVLHQANLIETFVKNTVVHLPEIQALRLCPIHTMKKDALLWDLSVAALQDVLLVTNQFIRKKQKEERDIKASKKLQIVSHL